MKQVYLAGMTYDDFGDGGFWCFGVASTLEQAEAMTREYDRRLGEDARPTEIRPYPMDKYFCEYD